MPQITVLMGIPGAGKSYWAKSNRAENTYIASTDPIRTQQIDNFNSYINYLRRESLDQLNAGNSVIADATHIDRSDRLWWLKAANSFNATSRLVVIQASLKTCLSVQANRTHPVPSGVVRKYHYRLEQQLPLIRKELWDEIIYINRS